MAEEKIGNIILDLSHYCGQDFYCDGAVEDELLRIARDLSPLEYAEEIERQCSWPILYHLSPLRENIVDWIPMDGTEKVLEVGSGCGAITGALARKAGHVTCVDLSKKRSMINAYRHAECDNVEIHVGNFKDIEPDLPRDYDYICLIGVFEYAQGYIGGETPYEDFLKILLEHLAKNGRIIIAIENQYGLKYFAGCKEDHLGTWFSGIENYGESEGVRTFSRRRLERILRTCGVTDAHFYYPYPDYKFMTTLYSDAYLPGKGELSNNLRNFDRDRMVLFDEKNAFDGLVEDGLFSVFANSYLVVIGGDYDIKYARFSNDRDPKYRICTQILRDADGKASVRKLPMGETAYEHVRDMYTAFLSLSERYREGELAVNKCKLCEQPLYCEFEFVEGRPLTELLDECLERNDQEGFFTLFRQYVSYIGCGDEMEVTNYDPAFSNILVNGEKWTLIDYEWTFAEAIETKQLAFRALYCYLLENEKRNKLNLDRILEDLEITESDAEQYRELERSFQLFVTGDRKSMAELRDLVGGRLMVPQKWIERYQDSENVNRVQIYEDCGEGFSEDRSYFLKDAYCGENRIEATIQVDGNVHVLRIDPAMDSCMVKILALEWNGETVPLERKKLLLVNGRIAKDTDKDNTCYQPTIVFPTQDPNLGIDVRQLERKAENTLSVVLEVVRIPLAMARDMAASVKKLI